MPTLGEAISLGNLASIDRSKPFTQAVMRRQALDMSQEEKRAKEEAEKKKRVDDIISKIDFGKGGYLPHFQEQAARITGGGIEEQLSAAKRGDQLGMAESKSRMYRQLEELSLQQDAAKQFLSNADKMGLPKDVVDAFGERYSTGNPKLNAFLNKNPQYKELITVSPEGQYTFNPVEKVDLKKAYDSTITSLESNMANPKYVKDLDNNTAIFELSASPDEIAISAVGLARDPSYRSNLRLQEPQRYAQELAKITQVHPELPPDQAELLAAGAIAEQELQSRNKKIHYETRFIPTDVNVNLDPNVAATPSGIGNQTTIKKKLAVPDGKGGFKYESKDIAVESGAPQGFKVVKVLNARGDDYINLNGGKRMKGQSIQSVDIGNARPYPVATKKMKDKLGKVIEAGEVVTSDQMQSLIDQDAIEYIPMFEGLADSKDGDGKKIQVSVLVPASKARSSVLLSQSKDDIELTDQSIKRAVDEANKLNSELPKRKKSRSAPKSGNNKKTISGF